jgi:glyoxylate/hydroxypyruvate/2-ketogluconate reductase
MRPTVVVTRKLFDAHIEQLRREYEVIDNQKDLGMAPEALRDCLAQADAALIAGGERVDAPLLAACPELKVVANVAVGYNNFDLDACSAAGVLATNTPDVLNEAVADHAWALLLAAARRVGESERWLRAGQWRRWTFDGFLGAQLAGSTLGILGMGRIGRAIARRAAGFSMRVLYHNRSPLAAELAAGAEYADKATLLAQADSLIVVVPYSPAVHHTIGAAELAQMKKTAVLVNIARGGVIDDAALIKALREGRIAAAGLDVFEGEPRLNQGFLQLENAVLTPHIASATAFTRDAMAQLAIRNVVEALAGRRPPTLLNPQAWDNRRR